MESSGGEQRSATSPSIAERREQPSLMCLHAVQQEGIRVEMMKGEQTIKEERETDTGAGVDRNAGAVRRRAAALCPAVAAGGAAKCKC